MTGSREGLLGASVVMVDRELKGRGSIRHSSHT